MDVTRSFHDLLPFLWCCWRTVGRLSFGSTFRINFFDAHSTFKRAREVEEAAPLLASTPFFVWPSCFEDDHIFTGTLHVMHVAEVY